MELSDYFKSGRGRPSGLARAIDAPISNMSDWASGKRPVPTYRCLAIERATGGLVTRGDLRPNDGHLIWPDIPPPGENPCPTSTTEPEAAHG